MLARMPTSTTPIKTSSPLPIGADGPLAILMNSRAGHEHGGDVETQVRDALKAAGRTFDWIDAASIGMASALRRASACAAKGNGTLVAIGGDGTINSAAAAAIEAGIPLGVIPRGTFNYFARALDIPLDVTEATQALLSGRMREVQVGSVNGRIFLVNASLGLYPQLLEDREAFLQRAGRNRPLALLSSLLLALRGWRQLRVESGSEVPALRTPTLFICNNRVQLERLGFDEELLSALQHGRLVGLNAQAITTLQMLALILRGAVGRLGDADRVERFSFSRMVVRPPGRRRMKVAVDGEVLRLQTPIVIEVLPQPLRVLAPVTPADSP
jgi:diacylglycerol kinase family enzyme